MLLARRSATLSYCHNLRIYPLGRIIRAHGRQILSRLDKKKIMKSGKRKYVTLEQLVELGVVMPMLHNRSVNNGISANRP